MIAKINLQTHFRREDTWGTFLLRVIKKNRRGLFQWFQSPHERKGSSESVRLGSADSGWFQRLSVDRCTADSHYASEIKDEEKILQNREEAAGKILIKTALLKEELPSGVDQINGPTPPPTPSFMTDRLWLQIPILFFAAISQNCCWSETYYHTMPFLAFLLPAFDL